MNINITDYVNAPLILWSTVNYVGHLGNLNLFPFLRFIRFTDKKLGKVAHNIRNLIQVGRNTLKLQ